MTDQIPFALPDITGEEIAEVVAVLESGWLTSGQRSKRFETEFAAAVGAKHAVAVNSCTAAMHLALEALGIGPDDEVIVPTMTFASSAEVVRYMNAKPVLVDIRADDHNIDPAVVERAISPRTRAILGVDFAGIACPLDELLAIARPRGLHLVEDAAHAFPTGYNGRTVGHISDITCFSFYATKTLTTGEGGMATTDDESWADRMKIMSLHGISKNAWNRYSQDGSWYYDILAPGFKYNMSDIAAALGLVQLRRAEQMSQRRQAIAEAYQTAFAAEPALELLRHPAPGDHAWHLYVVKIRPQMLTLERGRFIEELKERGIATSVHFIPLHLHPYYRQTYGYQPSDFPVALDAYSRSISLPIYSKMTDDQVARVIEAVLDVAQTFRR
jgi:perosamine synthetase